MKKTSRIIYSCFILLVFSNTIYSQKLNRLNKKGHRTGKWITYIDDAKKLKSFEGHFKNGISSGARLNDVLVWDRELSSDVIARLSQLSDIEVERLKNSQ